MEKLNNRDIEILCKTILIGLPTVGKSAITDELCVLVEKDTGIKLENVSSDIKIREVRKDKNDPVIRNFMKEHNIPIEDFPLLIKTSDFIKKYGEEYFRNLESDIIVDMFRKGEFRGKMPNLGGKAILHPRTAATFKKAGYNIVYLKSNPKNVAKNVAKDFERWLDGEDITRSNINDEILQKLKEKTHLATVTPTAFVSDFINKSRNPVAKRSDLRGRIRRQANTIIQYDHRIEIRDSKAVKIITVMDKERSEGYEKASNAILYVSGDKEKDISELIRIVRQNSLINNKQKFMGR